MKSIGRIFEIALSSILTVAIISVIVSRNSTTPGVLQALGSAFSNILGTIVAPISNGTAQQSASTQSAFTAGSMDNAVGQATVGSLTSPTGVTNNAGTANTGSTDVNH